MGIKNGSSLMPFIRTGIYNRKAANYKIIVDGEFMRYKGMTESNLTKHNLEEAVAASSYDYLHKTLHTIEMLLGHRASGIIVFMDGSRVMNKETSRADFNFDVQLIRTIFKSLCQEHGLAVNELHHGESELQMYLQRDKNVNLNVFLTNDSDMISICYGHVPTSKSGKFEYSSDTEHRDELQQNEVKYTTDLNLIYKNPTDITDSCAWINCNKDVLTIIGFDFLQTRYIYTPEAFRVFVALCGTDFTSSLLTTSMIDGIMMAEDDDKMFINSLEDVNHIAACFQMLGIRGGGTIKRFNANVDIKPLMSYDADGNGSLTMQYNENELCQAINMYRDYIKSGHMLEVNIPRPNMPHISRQFLYAMRNQDPNFVKKSLCSWAKMTPLAIAVENLKQHLGTFNIFEEQVTKGITKIKKSPNKQKKSTKISITEA